MDDLEVPLPMTLHFARSADVWVSNTTSVSRLEAYVPVDLRLLREFVLARLSGQI